MTPNLVKSALLASNDPERLARWYASVFEPNKRAEVQGHQMLDFAGFHLLIAHRADHPELGIGVGPLVLNFDVDSATAIAAKLRESNSPFTPRLLGADGLVLGTAVDPEGNQVGIVAHAGHNHAQAWVDH